MTRKITFPQLVAELSQLTSSDEKTAGDFIKELFDTISSGLAAGESVTVKGIGTFMLGIGNDISWIPDEQLAADVNEPFAFFDAVELEDGVTEETLNGMPPVPDIPETSRQADTDTNVQEEVTVAVDAAESRATFPAEMPPIPDTDDQITEPASQETEVPAPPSPEETMGNEETIEEQELTPEYSEDEPYYEVEEEPRKKCRLLPCMTFVLGLILGLPGGYFGAIYAGDHFLKSEQQPSEKPELPTPALTDSIAASPLADEADADTIQEIKKDPAKAYLAIDTVAPNRYLTTMSRHYYGDYRFWVYIYEENRSTIADPNRLNPGTPVIIPLPEKYGINASDKESVAKAELKSAEIQGQKVK